MYCTKCGAQNSDGFRYCTACGAAADGSTAPVPDSAFAYGAGAPASAPPHRLRRILETKKIAGVCAGFAEYFDMDVTLVRLIWVGLALLPPSPGVLIYVIAWIVLPKS